MGIDTVRRQAHRLASQGGENNVNYNPFARVRTQESPADVENQAHRTRSTEQRQFDTAATEKEYTPPVAAAALDSTAEQHAESSRRHTKDSSDGTIVDSSSQSASGVSKRAKFKGVFRKEHEGEDDVEVESEQLSMEERRKKALKKKIPIGKQVRYVLFGAWINVLLVMVPVGFAAGYVKFNILATFIINFVAIIPLAAMLSNATEELAIRVGETMGGLLNATFGYVTF